MIVLPREACWLDVIFSLGLILLLSVGNAPKGTWGGNTGDLDVISSVCMESLVFGREAEERWISEEQAGTLVTGIVRNIHYIQRYQHADATGNMTRVAIRRRRPTIEHLASDFNCP